MSYVPDRHLSSCAVVLTQMPDVNHIDKRRLPAEVLNKAAELNIARQRQFLSGRAILAQLLSQFYGVESLPEINTSQNGRPFFCQPELPNFNISHSGGAIMVAIGHRCQVGLDLELKRPRNRLLDIAQYSFSEAEYLWLTQMPVDQFEQGFWQLWTLRESILKLAGKGVWQMKELTILPQQRQLITQFNQQLSSWSYVSESLFWSLATDFKVELNNISFWQTSPDLSQLQPRLLPDLTLFLSSD